MRRVVVLTLLGASLGPPIAAAQRAPSLPAGAGGDEAVASITPRDIAHRIGVIAHDSMRGRDTPSPELEEVARYIAAHFEANGLEATIQRYPLRRVRLDVARSGVDVPGGATWRVGSEVLRHFGAGREEPISAPAVFLAGSPGEADARAGGPLSGNVVFFVTELGGALGRDLQRLLAAEPAAVILVTRRPGARWAQLAAAQDRERGVKGRGEEASAPPLLEVHDSTAAGLLGAHGIDLAALRAARAPAPPQPLGDLRLSIRLVDRIVEEFTAPNVVGVLQGGDPALREEYVVFSAHMDHVGVGTPVRGDSIYNGADDDASGTVGIMELAEAFALLDPRPRRSLVFLAVSGEEKGLWGSEYFTADPPVPVEQMVANLNLDMIGRNWTDTIVAIGREHSDLGATLERVNAAHPELGMTAIDDLWPEQNFYRRSDHFNFARRGVPILFFFNGTHEDYHRPSDEPPKVDAEKTSRIVKLLFYLGLEIANADDRPRWNPDSYREIVEGR